MKKYFSFKSSSVSVQVRRNTRNLSVVVRPSTIFKDLLLQNRWANQKQISCEASMGRGKESLFGSSGSHDQDGLHVPI